ARQPASVLTRRSAKRTPVTSTCLCRAMRSRTRKSKPLEPSSVAPSVFMATSPPPTTSFRPSPGEPRPRSNPMLRVIDVQAHVLPRVYLDRLAGRATFPRAERDGAERWWLISGPGLRTPVTPAMLDVEVRLAEMDR